MDFLLTILIFAAIAYFNKDKERKGSTKGSPKKVMQKPVQKPVQNNLPQNRQRPVHNKPKLDLEDFLRELSRQMGVEVLEEKPQVKPKVKQKAGSPANIEVKAQERLQKKTAPTKLQVDMQKEKRPVEKPAVIKKKPADQEKKELKLIDFPETIDPGKRSLAEGMIWSQILGEPRSRRPYKPVTLNKDNR